MNAAAALTTYEDSQEKIAVTVTSFFHQNYDALRSIGWLDFEDLTARANLHFATLLHRWNNGLQTHRPFLTEVGYWVWYCLMDEMRMEINRKKHIGHPVGGGEAALEFAAGDDAIPLGWLQDCSPDARACVRMVLGYTKTEEAVELARLAEEKGGQARNYRSALRAVLDGMGWRPRRVAKAFEEIQAALA